jgi:hypothetical protein
MAFFLSTNPRTNLPEYENYVYSVKPMPLDQIQAILKAQRKDYYLLSVSVILALPLSAFLLGQILKSELSLTSFIIIPLAFTAILSPFIYSLLKRKKINASLVPYGLTFDDVSDDELTISEYRQLTNIQNPQLLKALHQIIEFRGGHLMFSDYQALRINTYFDLTTPRQADTGFAEKREILVKKILDNSEQAA